jgi:hypothetical protein
MIDLACGLVPAGGLNGNDARIYVTQNKALTIRGRGFGPVFRQARHRPKGPTHASNNGISMAFR